MKIKEVEDITGINNKNIRFYEKEGLMCPKRNLENGYRDYSKNDIKKLKEIKLFRKLGVSIEDIHLLQTKSIELKTVMEKQILNFKNEIYNLNEARELCTKIKEQKLSFDQIDADVWLFKIIELENKGAKFMNINNDEIIRFLPDKFKMQYYESIIKSGQIDNTLLGEITTYFENIYKEKVDTENLLMTVLKEADVDEKSKLMILVKENNPKLYDKITKNIFDFEDIITLDKVKAKKILEKFNSDVIVKALMGASPKVNEYVKNLLPGIDYLKEKQSIGSIPINEIIKIHNEILEAINKE